MTDCKRCFYHGKHYADGKVIKGMECSMEEFHPDPGNCPFFVEWRGRGC